MSNPNTNKSRNHSVCAVAVCHSPKGEGISYHRFPKDPDLRQRWINACLRKDTFRPDFAQVCSQHFIADDFDRDLRNELLGLPTKKKLKPSAFPSQMLGSEQRELERRLERQRTEQAEKERQKKIVEELLSQKEYPLQNENATNVDSVVTAEGQVIKVALVSDLSALSKSNGQLLPGTSSSQARSRKRIAAARSMQPRGPVVTGLPPGVRLPTHPLRPPFTVRNPAKQVKIRFSQNLQTRDKAIQVDVEQCNVFQQLESQVQRLERTVERQKETISFLRKRLHALSDKKKPSKIAMAGPETPLSLVSADNLHKVDRRKIWSEEEIVNCLMLKTVSKPAYEFIRQNQMFPIPSVSTLQKFSHLENMYRITQSGYVEKIYFPGYEAITDLDNSRPPVPSNRIHEPECEIEMIE